MKILPGYREGLEKELKDCGIDPEQGLGREIVKQFEFSFELHDRVKALEDEARKNKKGSCCEQSPEILEKTVKVTNQRPDVLKVRHAVNAVTSAMNGLSVAETKLCLRLSESVASGQTQVQTEPIILIYGEGRDGEIESVGWMLSEKVGKREVD